MNNDEFYMKLAYSEAKKAYDMNEIPVGAVIVLDGVVVSKAHNLKDSTGIVTNHAEIIAIEKANCKIGDWRLTDAVMYVTLEPCPMCASAIQQSRISKIVYGASSGYKNNLKKINSILNDIDSNHIVEIIKNTRFEQLCKSILNDFFQKMR